MKKLLYTLLAGWLLFSACNDDEATPGNGTAAKTRIQFGITVYSGLTTRSARPLYSSEALQQVNHLTVYAFRKNAGDWLYAGKNYRIEEFNASVPEKTEGSIYRVTEELENGEYRFLAIGHEEGYEGVFVTPAFRTDTTKLEEVVLTLKDGKEAMEVFSGTTPTAIKVANGKSIYANIQLGRAVAGVLGYFVNIPYQANGQVVKSVVVKATAKSRAVRLCDGTSGGTQAESYNIMVFDLSNETHDGRIYTCDAVGSGEYTKMANSWLAGKHVMPVEGTEGKATLEVCLCSDAAGQTPVQTYEVKCLVGSGTSEADAQKDFGLEGNYFYGIGQKSRNNEDPGNGESPDRPIDLSASEQIIINSEVNKLFPNLPDYGIAMAFPTAVGFGRNASGARGSDAPEVYRVTTLSSSGAGSFADAVSKAGRYVVFDVAGVINLKKATVVVKNNVTIMGQTAPGDGVVLYNGRVSFSGGSNSICRYMRIRMGKNFGSDADAAGLANGRDIILDHCSMTWARDENFSINGDGKGTAPQNITVQNSFIGQGLQNHSCGGLIQTSTDNGVTLFRNLYIDNKTRNPKVKGLNQFVNNVLYNWGNGAAYNMGGDSEGPSETDIENNYFIKGPGENYRKDESDDLIHEWVNPTPPFTGANQLFRTYLSGNYYDDNKDGALDGHPLSWDECSGNPTFLDAPSLLHPVISGKMTAPEAYRWVVENGGASLPVRDQVDAYLIEELTSLGIKGTILQSETDKNQYPLGGPGSFADGTKPLDTDSDGMPDRFEDYYGLDKNDPLDAVKIAKNGYSNLENYVFQIENEQWKED